MNGTPKRVQEIALAGATSLSQQKFRGAGVSHGGRTDALDGVDVF